MAGFSFMKLYPVHLLLEGKRVLIVGGGEVAAAKARALLEGGAAVRLVAPEIGAEVKELTGQAGVAIELREFTPEDLEEVWMAIAATDRHELNQFVFELAERRKILVCSVDQPSRSNFIAPAVLRRGDLLITVSTSGRAPALAARIRNYLGEIFGEEYGLILDRLRVVRERLKEEYPDFHRRRQAWYRLIDTKVLPALRRREMPSLELENQAVPRSAADVKESSPLTSGEEEGGIK